MKKSFLIFLPFISPPRFFYDKGASPSLSLSPISCVSVSLSTFLPTPSPPTMTRKHQDQCFFHKCNVSSSKWESVYLFQRSRLCSEHFQSFHCELRLRLCGIFFCISSLVINLWPLKVDVIFGNRQQPQLQITCGQG